MILTDILGKPLDYVKMFKAYYKSGVYGQPNYETFKRDLIFWQSFNNMVQTVSFNNPVAFDLNQFVLTSGNSWGGGGNASGIRHFKPYWRIPHSIIAGMKPGHRAFVHALIAKYKSRRDEFDQAWLIDIGGLRGGSEQIDTATTKKEMTQKEVMSSIA